MWPGQLATATTRGAALVGRALDFAIVADGARRRRRRSERAAALALEDDQRVVAQALLVERRHHPADLIVDRRDLSGVAAQRRVVDGVVAFEIGVGRLVGRMRRVEGEVEEERGFRVAGLDQLDRLVAELRRRIGGLAVADQGDFIACALQRLGQGPLVGRQRGGVAERIASGQKRGAGRPARRSGVELVELRAARGERVDVRRLDAGAVEADVLPALLVGRDHDDVGPSRSRRGRRENPGRDDRKEPGLIVWGKLVDERRCDD